MEQYLADDYGAEVPASPVSEWDIAWKCYAGKCPPSFSPPPGFMIPVIQDLSTALSPQEGHGISMEAGTQSPPVNCFQTLAPPDSQSAHHLGCFGSDGGSNIPGIESQIYHAWGEDGATILQHLEVSGCELHQRIASFSFKQRNWRRPASVNGNSVPDPSDPGISKKDHASESILYSENHNPDPLRCPSPRTTSSAFHDHVQADSEGLVQVEDQVRNARNCCLSEDTTDLEDYCEKLGPFADPILKSHIEDRQRFTGIASSPEQDFVTTASLRPASTTNLEQAIKDFHTEVRHFEQAVNYFIAQTRCIGIQDMQVLEPGAKKQRLKNRHQFSREETVCLAKAVKKVLSFWSADQGPSLAFWEAVYEATNLQQPISPGKLQTKWRYELGKYCKWHHSRSAKSGDKTFKEWRSDYVSFCRHLLHRR